MNLAWAIILLAGGLAVLWKCAECLVAGAVGLANRLGVSPLVIGLTVVAMGTSAPEVAASIAAALRGVGDVAIGNVYGSNVANLALVGGLSALIRPVPINKRVLRREIPVMLLVALLLWPALQDLQLSRSEGAALLAVFAVLVLLTVYMVALGADMSVQGAVFIGEQIGLSNAVIGLTIIAVGTSLPELVTCVVAAVKGQHDISIGNLVGSNVFNTLLVVGAAGAIRPFGLSQRLVGLDYWIMIMVSAGFVLMAIGGRRISRVDGALLLCGYLGYMVYLLAYTAGM